MPIESVARRWTIATWLLARADEQVEAVAASLGTDTVDVVALQSVRERDAAHLSAALGCNHSWARSHHPRSRLLPGSAVGLAVLTPHRITASDDHLVGDHRSLWSSKRRIAQISIVERDDHSAYTIVHAAERIDGQTAPPGAAPPIVIRPAQIGVDDARAIQLPAGAVTVSASTTAPIDGGASLLVVTFEMPWVTGDFPLA